jgi:heme-degrading monooxygenase HmoA
LVNVRASPLRQIPVRLRRIIASNSLLHVWIALLDESETPTACSYSCNTNAMFSVIFEVHPKPDQWDAYLGNAKMLRPELEQVEGFVDNIRYKSLTREGWILFLSGWRDEKSVVRWRTKMRHHMVQEKGRSEILLGLPSACWPDHPRIRESRKVTCSRNSA